jgi:two-component system response regulator RegA
MSRKILVIDDDPHFSLVMNRSLTRQGFQSAIAEDEAKALSEARRMKPDWISLDLRLEKTSGLNLIPALLSIVPKAKILILTGYASIPTAVEAIKLGAHNYLHKPATLQELIAAFDDNPTTTPSISAPPEAQTMSVERLEWEHIQRALNEHQGNISATARALNMHRRTLQRKLQKYAPRS